MLRVGAGIDPLLERVKLLTELSVVTATDCIAYTLVSVPPNAETFSLAGCLVLNGPIGVNVPVYIPLPLTNLKLLIYPGK